MLAWGWRTGGRFYLSGEVRGVEVRGESRTEEEKVAEKWVMNNSLDPEKVKFVKWGPHGGVGKTKISALSAMMMQLENAPPLWPTPGPVAFPGRVVRVAYRTIMPTGVMMQVDLLMFVHNGAVKTAERNTYGDDWLTSRP